VADYFNLKPNLDIFPQLRGKSIENAAQKLLGLNNKKFLQQAIQLKIDYTVNNLNNIKLFPTVLSTLKVLKEKKYKLWICTSATKKMVDLIFDQIKDLSQIFGKNVIYSELTSKGKPDPEPLNLAVKKAGNFSKKENLYIGDTLIDLKTALAAGVEFVLFNNAQFEDDNLKKFDIIKIKKHSQILKLLDN
jgi:phosphoglycolate phosphatase